MTPTLATEALLTYLKGSTPPQKLEGEETDAFQGRTIDWLKAELKSIRGIMWVVLLMQLAEWAGAY